MENVIQFINMRYVPHKMVVSMIFFFSLHASALEIHLFIMISNSSSSAKTTKHFYPNLFSLSLP